MQITEGSTKLQLLNHKTCYNSLRFLPRGTTCQVKFYFFRFLTSRNSSVWHQNVRDQRLVLDPRVIIDADR